MPAISFSVRTQGPQGRMGDYEVDHTFGWNPLQQYLISFPGGRMQCLPIAWDAPCHSRRASLGD